jgi:hypothetical protein
MSTAEASSSPNHAHAVGPLAEEAGQLLDVVAAKLAGLRQEVPDAPEPADPHPADPHPADSTAGCVGWCPICRSADLLKGDRSETTQKLVDAALLVVTTLRSLIPAPPEATEATTGGDGSPGIERIDIR